MGERLRGVRGTCVCVLAALWDEVGGRVIVGGGERTVSVAVLWCSVYYVIVHVCCSARAVTECASVGRGVEGLGWGRQICLMCLKLHGNRLAAGKVALLQ